VLPEAPFVAGSNQRAQKAGGVCSTDSDERASANFVEILFIPDQVPTVNELQRQVDSGIEIRSRGRRAGRRCCRRANDGRGVLQIVKGEPDFLFPVVVTFNHSETQSEAARRAGNVRFEHVRDADAVLHGRGVFRCPPCVVHLGVINAAPECRRSGGLGVVAA